MYNRLCVVGSMIHRRVSMGKAPHNNNNYRIVVLFFLIYLTTGKYRAKIEHCYFLSLSNGQVLSITLYQYPLFPLQNNSLKWSNAWLNARPVKETVTGCICQNKHKILCFLIKLEFFWSFVIRYQVLVLATIEFRDGYLKKKPLGNEREKPI